MRKQREKMENEHLEENLFDVLEEVEQGLNMIEKNASVYTPDLEWFEHIVVEEKQRIRQRFILDVTAFAVVSLLILCTVLLALSRIPIIFFTAQGVVTVTIVAYFVIKYVKQVKET